MPDFKMCNEVASLKYLLAKDYSRVAQAALMEMHRQVGDLVLDENDIAKRGLLVRHLSCQVRGWHRASDEIHIAQDFAKHVCQLDGAISPDGKVDSTRFAEINRRPTSEEYQQALNARSKRGYIAWLEPP